MRLWAYGGREWGNQCKIGEWPYVAESTLRDEYGVPSGSVSYGVGFIGERLCLVYRERQNAHERTGYPYTVLIDPSGDDGSYAAWEAFHWNAAALLSSLLEESRQELLDPRTLTAARLREILDLAKRPNAVKRHLPPDEPDPTDATNIPCKWAQLLLGNAVASRAESVVATLSLLNATERPSLKTMAEWLTELPEEARLGRGWMVGMSKDTASGFGAHVTLDDQQRGEAADTGFAETMMGFGQQASALLKDVKLNEVASFRPDELYQWPDVLRRAIDEVKRIQREEAQSKLDESKRLQELQARAGKEPHERAPIGYQGSPKEDGTNTKQKKAASTDTITSGANLPGSENGPEDIFLDEKFRRMSAWLDEFRRTSSGILSEQTSIWTYDDLACMSYALWTMSTQAAIVSLQKAVSRSWWNHFATRWLPFLRRAEDTLLPATALRTKLLSWKCVTLVALWLTLPCIGLWLWLGTPGPGTWLTQHRQAAQMDTSHGPVHEMSTPVPVGAVVNASNSEGVEHAIPTEVGGNSTRERTKSTNGSRAQPTIHIQAADAGSPAAAALGSPSAIVVPIPTSQRPQERPSAQEFSATEISGGFIALIVWTLLVWRIAVTPAADVPKMSLACENDFAKLLESLGAADGRLNPALTTCVHRAFDEPLQPGAWLPAEIALLVVLAADKSETAKQAACQELDLKIKDKSQIQSRALKQLKRLGMLD